MSNLREKKDTFWDAIVFGDGEKVREMLEEEAKRRGWEYMSIRRLRTVLYVHRRDRDMTYDAHPEFSRKSWQKHYKEKTEQWEREKATCRG